MDKRNLLTILGVLAAIALCAIAIWDGSRNGGYRSADKFEAALGILVLAASYIYYRKGKSAA